MRQDTRLDLARLSEILNRTCGRVRAYRTDFTYEGCTVRSAERQRLISLDSITLGAAFHELLDLTAMVLAEIFDQYDIARLRAAREGDLFAIAREVEPEDAIGFKVG